MAEPEPQKYDFQHEAGEEPSLEEKLKMEEAETYLTEQEIQQVKRKETSIPKLAAKRLQLKADAEAKLRAMVFVPKDGQNIIGTKEFKEFSRELENERSPEKTQSILDRINNLPKEKEDAAKKEKEESVTLPPNDPKLLEHQKEFDKICNDNSRFIGESEIDGFKAWFREQCQKTPTVKALKEIIKRLEGKETFDRDGLAPRRTEFFRLETTFKKYGISSPLESDYIKQEGLSERQSFRKAIEEMETHFDTVKDTGFYSQKIIRKMMKENLMAKNPEEIQRNLLQAKNIAKQEAEAFVHLDSRTTVNGITIRKMSEKSKRHILTDYKEYDIQTRTESVIHWERLVENEADLARDLAEIYGDNKEGFASAMGSFEELDFIEKQAALKEHERLVEKSEDKEKMQKELTIKAAHAKIDVAASQNIIAESTREKYKEFFEDEENFKNPENHKPGDLKALKKAYELLISTTTSEKHKNLAAYKERRNQFVADTKKLKGINSSITDEEIQEWQNRYDEEGWTARQKVHGELRREIEKQTAEQSREKALKKKVGVKESKKDSDKEKQKEDAPHLQETVSAVTELLNGNQAAEAMKLLLEYNETDPDNPKILFWMETTARYMKEFGSGKKRKDSAEKEIEREMEEIVGSDTEMQESIEEEQIKTLNIKGAKISAQRHDNKEDAHERAKIESLDKTETGSIEEDLTEDAYSQMGEEYVLDEEGTGEEIESIYFDEDGMYEEDLRHAKEKTYEEQAKIDTKEGFSHVNLEDKSGRIISAKEAEVIHKEQLEELERKLTDKTLDKVQAKTPSQEGSKEKPYDLNNQIAARRKAKELIDKKRHEKLKQKA
ncbi:hypothetical protein A3I58_00915 [Candidatus Peregrinibacteria bacterium RIFCSPLOWO2_02_FULL_39_10]|nr:MAG: hypothetical protein A3I58_00915 [Candidatus Peregrinibacteria bacterium RIFCSPLOWO2_02_FULL_39_10]